LSGSWQWNLLGCYEIALTENESLESNKDNECHILFVSFINIIYYSHCLILWLKCLPNTSTFSSGSSYPPSTHVSGPLSHYAFSESRSALSETHSRPDTPMDVSVPSGSKCTIDENLLSKLKAAGLTINVSLCYDTNPSLQVMYQCYTHIQEIQAKVSDLVAEWKWPTDVGKYPNKTEIIGLFVAKTTWHNTYAKVFPRAEGYEDMLAWLEGDSDRKSDLDLWGTTKSKYSITDLEDWLKKQKGKKAVKPVMKSLTKTTKGAKEKEKKQGSGSGTVFGKGNQKGVESEQAENKKSHKGKKVNASG